MDPCRCSSDARGELQGRISDVEEGRFGVVALSCLQMSAKLGRASGSAAHARRISSRMSLGMVFGMSGRACFLNHNYRRRAVVLLFGRVFLDREFLPGEKVRSLVATLLSSHRLGVPLKNVIFLHQPAADGGRRGNCIAPTLPMTVIAKGRGYGQCGILIPNPYFGSSQTMRTKPGDLATWHRQASSLRTVAKARPFAMRDARAMWRGKCLNHENRANGTAWEYSEHRKEIHRLHEAGDFSHGHRIRADQRRLKHSRKEKVLRHRRERAERDQHRF